MTCIVDCTFARLQVSLLTDRRQNSPYESPASSISNNAMFTFQVTHVITTHELLPKFKSVLQRTPSVKHLIFLEDQVNSTDRSGYRQDVNIHGFQEVIELGKKSTSNYSIRRPTKDDPAIIMYTSGDFTENFNEYNDSTSNRKINVK